MSKITLGTLTALAIVALLGGVKAEAPTIGYQQLFDAKGWGAG
jgi:hypothetical protein